MDNNRFNNENEDQVSENINSANDAQNADVNEPAQQNDTSSYSSYNSYNSYSGGQYSSGQNWQNGRTRYYGNDYAKDNYYTSAYTKPERTKKQGASKGFVALMLCISIVLSGVVGFFAGYLALNTGIFSRSNVYTGNVVVDYAEKDTGNAPEVTDRGNSAYVASVAADTVVEVRTEVVTTSNYFGQYVQKGAGSGVIIDSTGYIITCAHVIEDATKITVELTNGDVHVAELVGSDTQTDVAVIKINVQNINHAVIGDSSTLVAGQHVVAIGNPLGKLGGTVTDGIISATNRQIAVGKARYNLLQTNAAINPGNSGGGLFDDNGNLIGIVNAKSTGDSIEGLGFAIPINDAMKVATDLMEKGFITGRVKLGVHLLAVNSETDYRVLLQYANIIDGYGIYIMKTETDSFVVGDKLIAIDGIAVSSLEDVSSILLDYDPGDVVTVTISRRSQTGRGEIMQIEHALIEKTAADYN